MFSDHRLVRVQLDRSQAALAGVALGEGDERAAVAEPLVGRVDGDVLELEHVVGGPDHEDAEHTSARLADPYLAGCDELA